MPANPPQVVTTEVVSLVEEYVWRELNDAEKYENSELLDESGIWSLHRLAAEIYGKGFRDGEFVESERQRRSSYRERTALEDELEAVKKELATVKAKLAAETEPPKETV